MGRQARALHARLIYATQMRCMCESPKIQNQPWNPSYFRDKFISAIGQIDGVRVLTPHSCRHTYVSQLQALGVNLPTIQSIVGHADIDMTQHYLRVQEPIRQAAVEKCAIVFGAERK